MQQAEIARVIAILAHRGQVDKVGEDYFEHPQRVVSRLSRSFRDGDNENDLLAAVGWLHDVLEDSEFTAADLRRAGVRDDIIKSVETLTKVPNEPNEDYYRRVSNDYFARKVKIADMQDNLDPKRLAQLDDATIARLVKKYAKGLKALGA